MKQSDFLFDFPSSELLVEAGDVREMPIRFILRQVTAPFSVYWSP